MKSPSTATDFTLSCESVPQQPRSKPSVRFEEADTPGSTGGGHRINDQPTRAPLPLSIQVACRRKHVAIIAAQLAIVTIGVVVLEVIAPGWLHATTADINVVLPLSIALVVLLIVLHFVRDKFPFNYAVLTLLTGGLVVTLAALDELLVSNIIALNCANTLAFAIMMTLTAGWTSTRPTSIFSCRGISLRWTPRATSPLGARDNGRQLVTPYLTGLVSFIVACGVLAAVLATNEDILASGDALIISFFAQIVVCCWVLYQIRTVDVSHTPDAYKTGAIYLYADILVML